jgi:hypothetical protein
VTTKRREPVEERIWHELHRIANALEALIPDPEEAPPTAPTCPHPPELRIDFGTTNGKPDWQCGIPACGYRTLV